MMDLIERQVLPQLLGEDGRKVKWNENQNNDSNRKRHTRFRAEWHR